MPRDGELREFGHFWTLLSLALVATTASVVFRWTSPIGHARLTISFGIGEFAAVGGLARPGHDLAGRGIAHVAEGVHRDQGGDQHAAGKRRR